MPIKDILKTQFGQSLKLQLLLLGCTMIRSKGAECQSQGNIALLFIHAASIFFVATCFPPTSLQLHQQYLFLRKLWLMLYNAQSAFRQIWCSSSLCQFCPDKYEASLVCTSFIFSALTTIQEFHLLRSHDFKHFFSILCC